MSNDNKGMAPYTYNADHSLADYEAGPVERANIGAVMVESARAEAEVKSQIAIARKFPRDMITVRARLLDSCKVLAFAEKAFYTLPGFGSNKQAITGPSIRFAEEVARCYEHFEYGHRELSRSAGKSEVEVFAWDKQLNVMSKRQITIMHTRDKKGGNVKLDYEKDIDDRIANVASKQIRSRILAIGPKAIIEEALEVCRQTLAGGSDQPLATKIATMVDKLGIVGVSAEDLRKYFETETLDALTLGDLEKMIGIYGAVKSGEDPALFFKESTDDVAADAIAIQNEAIARGRQTLEDQRAARKKAAVNEPVSTQAETGSEQLQPQAQEQKAQQQPEAVQNGGNTHQVSGEPVRVTNGKPHQATPGQRVRPPVNTPDQDNNESGEAAAAAAKEKAKADAQAQHAAAKKKADDEAAAAAKAAASKQKAAEDAAAAKAAAAAKQKADEDAAAANSAAENAAMEQQYADNFRGEDDGEDLEPPVF